MQSLPHPFGASRGACQSCKWAAQSDETAARRASSERAARALSLYCMAHDQTNDSRMTVASEAGERGLKSSGDEHRLVGLELASRPPLAALPNEVRRRYVRKGIYLC